jgi:FixJ family two-component response regulator
MQKLRMNRAAKAVVAVIDDDLHVLESLQSLLESARYSVRPYSSAERFLNDNADAEVHCVISDVGMPALDGIELQRRLLARHPALPVILITGRYDFDAPGVAGPNNRGFFRKPVDAYELLQAVATVITVTNGFSPP